MMLHNTTLHNTHLKTTPQTQKSTSTAGVKETNWASTKENLFLSVPLSLSAYPSLHIPHSLSTTHNKSLHEKDS